MYIDVSSSDVSNGKVFRVVAIEIASEIAVSGAAKIDDAVDDAVFGVVLIFGFVLTDFASFNDDAADADVYGVIAGADLVVVICITALDAAVGVAASVLIAEVYCVVMCVPPVFDPLTAEVDVAADVSDVVSLFNIMVDGVDTAGLLNVETTVPSAETKS